MSFQDFQKSFNRWTAREIGFLILAAILIILVISALGVANYYLAGLLPDGGEFYLLRTGGRAFLFDRIEPYSGTVPAQVQEQVYGRSALPGEDVYILDIPFHLLIVFFSLAIPPDVLIARTVWMALTEIGLAAFIILSFRLLDRRVPIFLIVLLFLAGFTSYYAYQSFLEGSPIILLSLIFAGTLLSLRGGLDELAGALLVLSTFQWEISAPFLLLIVLRVFWERRWRVFGGSGMLLFVLGALSFFIYPGWVVRFLRAAWNSFRIGFGFSMHDALASLWPDFGSTLGWVLTAILIVLLGYEWRGSRGDRQNRLIWTVALTFTVTPLLGLRMEMDQFVPLTLPVILIVVIARERWQRFGNGIALLLLLFFFGLPWLVHIQGLPLDTPLLDDEILFLFWPVSTFIGLYWVRWWTIRPPDIWVDQLEKMKQQ